MNWRLIKTPKEIKDELKEIVFTILNKRNYYNLIRVNGLITSESRFIWKKNYGKIPEGMFIHHINGNKTDNRIENLQMVSPQEHGEIHRKINKLKKC